MKPSTHSGIDESKESKQVWIIQNDNGSFVNENTGVGGSPKEFTTYKEALRIAKSMSHNYHQDYWVFELVDRVKFESKIEVENLRQ